MEPAQKTPPEGRTERLVAAVSVRAHAVVGKVRSAAAVFVLAAMGLWGSLFYPFQFESAAAWMAIGALLLALLAPAGIVYLFYRGLLSIARLPERLAATAGAGKAHAAMAWRAAVQDAESSADQRAFRLVGAIRDIRSLVGSSREMLVEYTVLFRMVNPLVLAVVGVAALAGIGLVIAAAIALLVAVF
ncbi:MAG: hypothetical protein R2834_21825 [Rhodothermales bacterium]